MKIAVATDADNSPARHFGEAPGYLVFTVVDNGRIQAREGRAKPVCDHGAGGGAHDESEDDGPDLHTRMSNVIADCQVVIAAGIPAPMYRHLQACGLQPVISKAATAEDAVVAFLAQ